MPCCVENCQRCAAHFGGFKFPWLGLWNSRGVVLPPDVAPNETWDYFYRHQERMDLLLAAAYTNFTTAPDLVPQDLYGLQLRCSAGDAGQLGLGDLPLQHRLAKTPRGDDPGQPGGQQDLEPTGHFTLQLGTARIDCGDPTSSVCWSCCVGLCSACFTWRQRCGHCGERRKMLSEV